MAEDELGPYLLVVVAVVAVIGVGLSAASFATNESMQGMMGFGGGGMMGGTGSTPSATGHPGAFEWAILILSAVFFVAALALLFTNRRARLPAQPSWQGSSSAAAPPAMATEPQPGTSRPPEPEPATSSPPPVPEPTLVKLLDEDEKRMYLELRDHGGEMFQRDLVALGIFSKAKVTRVLDKLETKGLVVREAHGMTNRVRLVNFPPK